MKNDLYRSDISGLRAVAVLLVIFYHVGFIYFPGGFIGVDVFFVLSGFLITTLVYKDVSKGSFTYQQFYVRRVRRLIPVLLVVIVVTCIAFWFVLLPDDYYRLANSAGASFLSVSNIYFNNITAGYWGASSQVLPLVHTWSLSVEEQFYIIWPTLLLLIQNLLPRKQHKFLLASAVIVLLFLSEYLARFSPNGAYYLLPARAFELLSGAFLAVVFVEMNNSPTINKNLINKNMNHMLSLIGLAGIFFMSFVLQKGDVFPGINAAVVCVSTMLLLFSGRNSENSGIVNQWLGNRIFVYIGLISYSLYLWHWPVIVFFNYFSIEKTLAIQLSIILLTFLLSVISYHGVEQVFRVKKVFSPRKTLVVFLLFPFIALLVFVLLAKKYQGFPERFSDSESNKISILISKHYKDCLPAYCSEDFKNKFSKSNQDSDFMLIGDSHAGAMEGFFNALANDAGKKGTLIVNGGNPFLIDLEEMDINSGQFTNFSKKNEQSQSLIESFKGDTVVITARYSKYTDKNHSSYYLKKGDEVSHEKSVNNFKQSMLATMDFVLGLNKKLIIIEDVPYFPSDKSKCDILKSLMGHTDLCTNSESLEVIADFQKIETEFFAEIKPKYPQVIFINPRELLCDEKYCYSKIDDVTLYNDNGHLNYVGSKLLGDAFLKNHANPLLEKAQAQ